MRFIYLFICCFVYNVSAANLDRCSKEYRQQMAEKRRCDNGVFINDVYYEKVVLIDCLQRVYYPNIDFETNTLFYSNTGNNPPRYGSVFTAHRTARLDLDTFQVEEIRGENDAYRSTLDKINHVIYSQSSSGVYAYNYVNGTQYEYFAPAYNVIQYVNGALYVNKRNTIISESTRLEEQGPAQLYYLLNGDFKIVEELKDCEVNNFIIDNDGDITFWNRSGLYTWKNRENRTYQYSISYPASYIFMFALDNYGNLYACESVGLYKVNKDLMRYDLYLSKEHLKGGEYGGLTFDRDNNIVYSDCCSVVKLVRDAQCRKPTTDASISWGDWWLIGKTK